MYNFLQNYLPRRRPTSPYEDEMLQPKTGMAPPVIPDLPPYQGTELNQDPARLDPFGYGVEHYGGMEPEAQPSAQDKYNELFNKPRPKRTAYEEFLNQPVKQENEGYSPSIWRRLGGGALGGLAMYGGVPGAMEAAQGIVHAPYANYLRSRGQEGARLKTAADIEGDTFDDQLKAAGGMATTEKNAELDAYRDQMAGVAQQRANTYNKSTEARVMLNQYKMDHPDFDFIQVKGGNILGFNPKNPSDHVDTGISSGLLTESEVIQKRGEQGQAIARITGGNAIATKQTVPGVAEKPVDRYIMDNDGKSRHIMRYNPDGTINQIDAPPNTYFKKEPDGEYTTIRETETAGQGVTSRTTTTRVPGGGNEIPQEPLPAPAPKPGGLDFLGMGEVGQPRQVMQVPMRSKEYPLDPNVYWVDEDEVATSVQRGWKVIPTMQKRVKQEVKK